MGVSIYTDTKLDACRRQIRLLTLLPSEDAAAQIRCVLHTSDDVAGGEPYRAISYAWGDPATTKPISVNDVKIHITVNLECALRYIRHASEPAVLWADAICINQTDDDEKSIQVALMGQIFGRAESVIAWLGQPTGDTDRVMDHICDLGMPRWNNASFTELNASFIHLGSSVSRFFKLDWWSRLWVIQEVRLARTVTFMCGSKRVTFQDLDRWTSAAMAISDARDICAMAMLYLQNQAQGPKSDNLFRLLSTHRGLKASKPEDRVYALLGLARDGEQFGTPDYTLPLVEIYVRVALLEYRRTNRLHFLCQCGVNPSGERSKLRLPSWVPDWSDRTYRWKIEDAYRAWPGGPVDGEPAARFSDDQLTLHLRAVFCDVVSSFKAITSTGYWKTPLWDHVLPSANHPTYRTGVSQLQAYWKTLHMGSNPLSKGSIDDSESTQFKTLTAFLYNRGLETSADGTAATCTSLDALTDLFLSWIGETRGHRTSEEILEPFLGKDGARNYSEWLSKNSQDDILIISATYRSAMGILIGGTLASHVMFTTSGGLLGNGYMGLQEGDLVCVVPHCGYPILLRPAGDGYMVVGACYVLGLMNGEIKHEVDKGKAELREIKLV